MTISIKPTGLKSIENKINTNFKGAEKPDETSADNSKSSDTPGEPVLGVYKNQAKIHQLKKDKTPKDYASYTVSKLNTSGRKTTKQDSENLHIIFSDNEDAAYFVDKILKARNEGFKTQDVLSLLRSAAKDFEDDFDFLLKYDNESLSAREIIMNIQAARNTDYPEGYKRLKEIFNIIDVNELLNGNGFLFQSGLVERFDEINEILFGLKPDKLTKKEQEFKNKYGINAHLDYNASEKNIDAIEEAVQIMIDSNRTLPKHIYITEFIDKSANGIFSPNYPDSLFIRPDESNSGQRTNTLLHEFVHLNDFDAKKDNYTYLPIDENIRNILHRYVSKYSSTNSNEFIAEVGTLMLQGIIKIDNKDKSILIKKQYTNKDNKTVESKAKDAAAIMKYYFSLGGQVFNAPSVPSDDTYLKVPLEL